MTFSRRAARCATRWPRYARPAASPSASPSIVDRTGRRTDFGLPFYGCLTLDIETHAPEQCPLCQQQVPLTIT